MAVAMPVEAPTVGQPPELGAVVDFYLVGLRTEVHRALSAVRTSDDAELRAAQEQFRWLLTRLRLPPGDAT